MRVDGRGHTGSLAGSRRVDLKTAAGIMGISSDAVRKRAKRGTLAHERGPDGKLYVWVGAGESDGTREPIAPGERLNALLAAMEGGDHRVLDDVLPKLAPDADPGLRELAELVAAVGGPEGGARGA